MLDVEEVCLRGAAESCRGLSRHDEVLDAARRVLATIDRLEVQIVQHRAASDMSYTVDLADAALQRAKGSLCWVAAYVRIATPAEVGIRLFAAHRNALDALSLLRELDAAPRAGAAQAPRRRFVP